MSLINYNKMDEGSNIEVKNEVKGFNWSKLFRDGGNKESSKRVAGMVGFVTFLAMSVIAGFHFYEIDTNLILGGLGICAGLLGVSTLTKQA